jgi:hypothetical protein
VYDIRNADPNASRLREGTRFVFSNSDIAAEVKHDDDDVVVPVLVFLTALFIEEDEDPCLARLERNAMFASALRAAVSRSFSPASWNDDDDNPVSPFCCCC